MPRRRHTRVARGQTLVLFVLTTLLMALMVLVTLQVGVRVKEKQELQMLADAAAYSNAVAAARTMNEISLLNRAQASFWVSMAADQGLISWASFQRANLMAMRLALQGMQNGTVLDAQGQVVGAGCSTGAAAQALTQFPEDLLGAADVYTDMDTAAGTEVLNIQVTINNIRTATDNQLARLLAQNAIGAPNPLTDALLQQARLGSPFPQELQQHATGSHLVNGRELNPTRGAGAPLARGSGMEQSFAASLGMRQAALGSRGEPWIVGHDTLLNPTMAARVALVPGLQATLAAAGGHVWGGNKEDDTEADPVHAAIAHDEGTLTVTLNGCTRTVPVSSVLQSSDQQDSAGTIDEHVVTPIDPGAAEAGDAERHTLLPCITCPSIWIQPIGFNPGEGEVTADANGQPKLYSVLHRDLAVRGNTDPWNLVFTFDVVPGEGGTGNFDNRGIQVRVPGGGATDISRQTALSTGMAYYHRKNQWQEFPNLMNPYWRATLVSADVDAQGKLELGTGDDVPRALEGPQTQWQAEAFRALKAAGFQGLH